MAFNFGISIVRVARRKSIYNPEGAKAIVAIKVTSVPTVGLSRSIAANSM